MDESCPTTCVVPAFNCPLCVTVAVVLMTAPVPGCDVETTDASWRPLWTASRLCPPARNVVEPLRRMITAWMRTRWANPITRTAVPLTRTRAPMRACARVCTVLIAPVLDETESAPRDLATTTPVKDCAAGAADGKIATVATTAAASTSFFMWTPLRLGFAFSRVRHPRKLARLLRDDGHRAGQLAAQAHEERLQRKRGREIQLLELAPRLADELAGSFGAGEPLGGSVLRELREAVVVG